MCQLAPCVKRLHVLTCHLLSRGFMCQHVTCYEEASWINMSSVLCGFMCTCAMVSYAFMYQHETYYFEASCVSMALVVEWLHE